MLARAKFGQKEKQMHNVMSDWHLRAQVQFLFPR